MSFKSFWILLITVEALVGIFIWWLNVDDALGERIMLLASLAVLALYWVMCFVDSVRQWILNRRMIKILERGGNREARNVADRKKRKLYFTAILMPLFSPFYLAEITSDARELAALFESKVSLSPEQNLRLSNLQEAQLKLLWGRAAKGPCQHMDKSRALIVRSSGPVVPSFGPPPVYTYFWCKYCLVKWTIKDTYPVITHF